MFPRCWHYLRSGFRWLCPQVPAGVDSRTACSLWPCSWRQQGCDPLEAQRTTLGRSVTCSFLLASPRCWLSPGTLKPGVWVPKPSQPWGQGFRGCPCWEQTRLPEQVALGACPHRPPAPESSVKVNADLKGSDGAPVGSGRGGSMGVEASVPPAWPQSSHLLQAWGNGGRADLGRGPLGRVAGTGWCVTAPARIRGLVPGAASGQPGVQPAAGAGRAQDGPRGPVSASLVGGEGGWTERWGWAAGSTRQRKGADVACPPGIGALAPSHCGGLVWGRRPPGTPPPCPGYLLVGMDHILVVSPPAQH